MKVEASSRLLSSTVRAVTYGDFKEWSDNEKQEYYDQHPESTFKQIEDGTLPEPESGGPTDKKEDDKPKGPVTPVVDPNAKKEKPAEKKLTFFQRRATARQLKDAMKKLRARHKVLTKKIRFAARDDLPKLRAQLAKVEKTFLQFHAEIKQVRNKEV